MSGSTVVDARDVSFAYGERSALGGVSFAVAAGAHHVFLGPNGSGKSTLFKLLATLLPMQRGEVTVLGHDLRTGAAALRSHLGVVFQSPAVDRKLSVRANLAYGGAMFGLSGRDLEARIAESLARTGLADRAGDRVEKLSGGLRRRVELAKVLLHRPGLLLLDEPSTGLDPTARRELWSLLRGIEGLTVLFTTHLLDEADRADRVLILDAGRMVAEGTPRGLADAVGGTVLKIEVGDEALAAAAATLHAKTGLEVQVVDGGLRAQVDDVGRTVPGVVQALGPTLRRLTISPPTLEDVFFVKTGSPFVERPATPRPATPRDRS